MTLREVILEQAENTEKGIHFYTLAGEWQRHSYAELIAQAQGRTGQLQGRVALMLPTGLPLVEALLATWLAGGTPCCLPLPGRLSPAGRETLDAMLERGRFCRIVRERLPEGTGDPGDNEVALVQFSSGTTSAPRPVQLTHANLLSNVHAILARFPGGPQAHRGLSWLPLYHDMGLIGAFLTALVAGEDLTLLRPEDFAVRPLHWLRAMHATRATISPASNFALQHCVDRIPREALEGLDLGDWNVLPVGAEPVQAETLEAFARHLEPTGFQASALTPVYGLAEATLAVTFSAVQDPPRVLHVDQEALAEGIVKPGERPLVGVGPPLPNLELDAPCGRLGPIRVKGPSVMLGYLDEPPAGEWLDTGDLGFLHEGELYVYGRSKDLIIIHGRNYDPEGVEAATGQRCAAFSMPGPGTERLVLVVERPRARDPRELAREVKQRVAARTGLICDEVHVVDTGSLPRTTSGKIRRAAARRALELGTLCPTSSS